MPQRHQIDPPNLDHLVPHVRCPRCGTNMRFALLTPDLEGREQMQFDCDCGFTYQVSAADPAEKL